MNKTLRVRFSGTLIFILLSVLSYGQTTVTSILTAGTTTTPASSAGVVTFAVRNNNAFPIAVTDVAAFHHSNNNGKTYNVWYHPTALTGAPSITAANGWQQLGTSPIISATTGITPLLTNKYLVIPANTTYRFAVAISAGANYYTTSTTNTWSNGGVDILTGNNTTSPGYAGAFPSPTVNPATFSGAVTFVTAAADNITTLSIVQPTANAQFCSYTSTLVRAVIRNVGTNSQTNIPVTAVYTSSAGSATITGTYTGTLLPFTSDTVNIGTILPPAGFQYTLRAYSELATDNVFVNDTTPNSVTITYKPVVPVPVVFDDTVCSGGTAFIGAAPVALTYHKWYSAPVGGTLVNMANNLTIPNLLQDSILYISDSTNGCISDRVAIHAIVGPPPSINLPDDTSFCESIPLILDAGNPGGEYLWSTGDTTQFITVTNVSGSYSVIVNKYCVSYDTVNVTIAPLPSVSGISYIKLGNTYHFNASTVQHVDDYLWIFGDGNTSTAPTPIYTYAGTATTTFDVILVVSNSCGTDTVTRPVSVTLDVTDAELDASVTAYPNPASSLLRIKTDKAQVNEVYIMDMMGNVVSKNSFGKVAECAINVDQLATGNYILNIRTTEGNIHKPLQILR